MRALLLVAFLAVTLGVNAKSDEPVPTGELLSMGYLTNHSFADALLKYKTIEDRLKANSTDKQALWELGLVNFTIAHNDRNYVNSCLEAWDNYLRLYPNDAFALWNRAFVKNYFKTGDACADVQSAMQVVKKKFLPKEPEALVDCLKKKKKKN